MSFGEDDVKQCVHTSTMELASTQPKGNSPEPKAKRPACSKRLDKLFGNDNSALCLSSIVEEEMQLFFSERPAPNDTDPLLWWRANEGHYPHLARLARTLLCMTATLVPAEQVCSACGVLVNKLRSALSPSTVDAMIFLAKNGMLQSARSTLHGQPERFAFVPSTAIVCEDNEEEDVPVLPQLEAESPDSDSDA